MYRSVPVEENETRGVATLLLSAIAALALLGFAVFIALFEPEWVNFMWLSVATISLAGVAGWVIGHFLDALFEDAA